MIEFGNLLDEYEVVQEGAVLRSINADSWRNRINKYIEDIPHVYWLHVIGDINGEKVFGSSKISKTPEIQRLNGVNINDNYTIKNMYNVYDLYESCEKIGKGAEYYPIGTLKPSGYISITRTGQIAYIIDNNYKEKLGKVDKLIEKYDKPNMPEDFKKTNVTIEDIENENGITLDKDFKKFLEDHPGGIKFEYPMNKIVSQEIIESIEDEGNPTLCGKYAFIDCNSADDLEISDYCVYIGGWIDDKALWLATNKSSIAPNGTIIFADVPRSGYDYSNDIFARSFKELMKNAKNIESVYKESYMIDESDVFQEGFIRRNKEAKKYAEKLESYIFNVSRSLYWSWLISDYDGEPFFGGGNKLSNRPMIQKLNGKKLDNKYSIENMYNIYELDESCTKLGKRAKYYPIGTVSPSGQLCITGEGSLVVYVINKSDKKRIGNINALIKGDIKPDQKYTYNVPGSLEAIEKKWNIEFDAGFKSTFNKLIKTKPEAFDMDVDYAYFPNIICKGENPEQFAYKLDSPGKIIDSRYEDYYSEEADCVCFAYSFPIVDRALLWVATKTCKKYKPGTILRAWDFDEYDHVYQIASSLQDLLKKSRWLPVDEINYVEAGWDDSKPEVIQCEYDLLQDEFEMFQETADLVEPFTQDEYDVFIEAKIDAAERNELDDSDFGIPELRKYPLTDKIHVQKAVQMFSHCPEQYKKQLKHRILYRAHKFGMDTSKWESLKDHKE